MFCDIIIIIIIIITKQSSALYIGMAKVLPIIDVQVNKKSCRLRMATKETKERCVWAEFDAHTHHHCQEIHNNKYYMGLLLVAMATIEVDSV